MKSTPAFPARHFDLADYEHGMTLRDYFAAQALKALVQTDDDFVPVEEIVQGAYQYADAMLKARDKT